MKSFSAGWNYLEQNLRIKTICAIDSKSRPVTFTRVQENSNCEVMWYNVDYPVMDEYLSVDDLIARYDVFSVVGFYPEGKQPPHVCGVYSKQKCDNCRKLYDPVPISGVHLHVGGKLPAKPKYPFPHLRKKK